MERIQEVLCYYIALIRSVALVHKNSHWLTNGPNFYGDHLLFDRIYKTAADDADALAEKLIGLFGPEVLDLHMQAQMIGKILKDFSTDDPIQTSLEAEKKFLYCSEKVYTMLEREGDKLTLGLDDLLMSIASNRETAVYLLQQTLGTSGNEMNSKMSARKKLLQRVKNAQVDMEAERKAFAQLKNLVFNALLKMVSNDKKGVGGAVFKTEATRASGQIGYTYKVLLAKNTPEANYAQQLQAALPAIIKQVPFFADKQVQASVQLVDSF
jgi:DNA-binding ferritin-like protein